MHTITTRWANPDDTAQILSFIKGLASRVDGDSSKVKSTETGLHNLIFKQQHAEVLLGELDGQTVGMAFFHRNFSTFLGLSGIYLEDLFVNPNARGRGVGQALLSGLAQVVLSRGYGRLEWMCYDHNSPAIKFYLGLGAVPMSEWTTYRVEGERLTALASAPCSLDNDGELILRQAQVDDAGLVYDFIVELAEYENMAADVSATPELLVETVFRKGGAEVLVAEHQGESVGFALYFNNYSTYQGQPGIYLEDLFVRPSARGKGIGKSILVSLARQVVQAGGGRFEWACLDWNEPSIAFYKALGASPLDDLTTYRLTGSGLDRVAKLK